MSRKTLSGMLAIGSVATVLVTGPAAAQLNISQSQRAADGTVYEVISVPSGSLLSGATGVRVTTVAGGTNGLTTCANTGSGSGAAASAVVGANVAALQSLLQFSHVQRTTVLAPNSLTVAFDSTASGKLTIGSGSGGFQVCREGTRCTGGTVPAATLVTLDKSDANVPAACTATMGAGCLGAMTTVAAFGFGLAQSANTCTAAPTTNETICSGVPTDGFTIPGGDVIVFIYDGSLGNSGFTPGVAGFGVSGPTSTICSGVSGRTVTADAKVQSAPPLNNPETTPTEIPREAPALGAPVSPAFAAVAVALLLVGIRLATRPRARRGS